MVEKAFLCRRRSILFVVYGQLLARLPIAPYTTGMVTFLDIEQLAAALIRRFSAWVASPFENLYRWVITLLVLAAFCTALPVWVGFIAFLPFATALVFKVVHVSKGIHRLVFIAVDEVDGKPELYTQKDRLQRAWVLGCMSTVVFLLLWLASRALFVLFPALVPTESFALYLAFATVLIGGFLFFYFCALRFDSSLMRGLASVAVTLPAFFVIVVVVSLLLSWVMRIVSSLGLSAESMIADGFSWVYDIQRILGTATDYFLQLDSLVIGASIVLAAVLLLLYTYTVPFYWMRSVSRWLKGLGIVAVVFSGAVLVFAGAWVVDVQKWASESEGSQLAQAIDSGVLSRQASALSGYRSDDLIALVKAFVLPYTVGVFVANAVVALRKALAKQKSDAILDSFAEEGGITEAELPELKKRYLFFGGNQTLWNIALRSVGHNVELPHPFAPRKLTWKERLTGELEEALPDEGRR